MASSFGREAAELGSTCYSRAGKPFQGYGTAGFRAAAEGLDHVMYRMGILAALRSRDLGGQAIGVMVTASHNPERDNGVKLVDPLGEMLSQSWESHATKLANAADDELASVIDSLTSEIGISDAKSPLGRVVIGRDTRASGVRFALAVADGVSATRSFSRSIGIATTPQLHYVVRCINSGGDYGVPSLLGYTDKYVEAFRALVGESAAGARYAPSLVVDCANGVGALGFKAMLSQLNDLLQVELRNTGEGGLNEGCGADFVKIKQAPAAGCAPSAGQRFATVDGDADRSMYFFDDGSGFRLLDGDRIALLLADFLAELLKDAGIDDLRLGLVQTAYANGASTAKAVESLGAANVVCAKTGVKHCHHAALEMDIGIYFEANGHGTAIFSDKFLERTSAVEGSSDVKVATAAKRLRLLRSLINEAVGDAISNILAVEAVLRLRDWSCSEWLSMYSDLPNRQIKVSVSDRSAFETTDAERKCVKPEGLQAALDALVATAPRGRAFVRPSGTEDVVRVYAEAETLEATLELAQAAVNLVYDKAGGVGARPTVT